MIRKPTEKEFYEVATMASNFEDHSSHVKVDPDHTVKVYGELVKSGVGVVFVIVKDGAVVGGIGGLKGPDLHYPRTIAVETFWFVLPEHRGEGLKLLAEFERWAVEKKCDCVAMIHLSDSHPKVLEKIYKRKGYHLVENHYLKVLS